MNNNINKSSFDLTIIVTSFNEDLINNFFSLLNLNNSIKLLVIFINQDIFLKQKINSTYYTQVIEINTKKIGISEARNIGLDFFFENKICSYHILFCDDDSTFDNYFFDNYKYVIKNNISYLFDVFRYGTNKLYISNNCKEGDLIKKNNLKAALGVNMLISFDVINKVKFFDINVGPGTLFGAAEDTDYFIRCINVCNFFIYTKRIYNFHPSTDYKYSNTSINNLLRRFINYGNGVVYIFLKHRLYIKAIIICFRSLGGSLYSLLKLDFRLSFIYFVTFFTRIYMMIKINFNRNKYFSNDRNISLDSFI